MDRAPGFYWLKDRRDPPGLRRGRAAPDPTIGYWDGERWNLPGADFTFADDDVDEFNGVRFRDRFAVLAPVAPTAVA